MKLTFLGHNTCLFGDSLPLLVDPILYDRYGDEYSSSPVEIYPPRTIDVRGLPELGGVLISHEHSDHFHVPSLNLLDRAVPIFVGPTMPAAITALLEDMGFSVEQVGFEIPVTVGEIAFTLYPPGEGTVAWENRVTQLHVQDSKDLASGNAFVTIDAVPSERFVSRVAEGHVPAPDQIIVCNNAQLTPTGVSGPTDNATSSDTFIGAAQRNPAVGVEVLASLVLDVVEMNQALDASEIIITGGGFLKDYEEMGPFYFADQAEVAEAANMLCARARGFVGPLPGEMFDLSAEGTVAVGQASWVRYDKVRHDELRAKRDRFIAEKGVIKMSPILPPGSVRIDLDAIQRDLQRTASALMFNGMGQRLLKAALDSGSPTPLCFAAIEGDIEHRWEYSTPSSQFQYLGELSAVVAPSADYVYGLKVNLADWQAILRGELQIWDIVGIATICWYPEGQQSLMYEFYNLYGEHSRPDTAYRVYEAQWSGIKELLES